MKKIDTFSRQEIDPNGNLVVLNNRTSVQIIPGKGVALKEGLRFIAYYDQWTDQEKLEHIRAEFIRVMQNPRTEPRTDWSILTA